MGTQIIAEIKENINGEEKRRSKAAVRYGVMDSNIKDIGTKLAAKEEKEREREEERIMDAHNIEMLCEQLDHLDEAIVIIIEEVQKAATKEYGIMDRNTKILAAAKAKEERERERKEWQQKQHMIQQNMVIKQINKESE